MEDIDYGALFGVDEKGEEVTEPADPSEDAEGAQGGNEQEIAGPDTEDVGEPGRYQEEEKSAGEEREHRQTPEENARFAAARRKAEAERDAAIAKAKEEAKEENKRAMDEMIRSMGIRNPYTKQPITTKAEMDEYRARVGEEKKSQLLKKSGMTDEEFKRFVQDLPEVKAAQAAREEAEKAAQAAKLEKAKLAIDEQLREITVLDPTIKDLSDLSKMENYEKIYGMVKKGYSLIDAFKLANYDVLTTRTAEASRQAAINAARGKEHLAKTRQRGAGAVSVPSDIKAEYRELNPGMTDAEIQQHYNKYLAEQNGRKG